MFAASTRHCRRTSASSCLQLLALDVERLMCQGMFRAAIGLQLLGCTAALDTPFNSGEHCTGRGR
jgi:hypothetical protein